VFEASPLRGAFLLFAFFAVWSAETRSEQSTTKYWAFLPKSGLPSERRSMSSFIGPGD
jgi:hypothetical protein